MTWPRRQAMEVDGAGGRSASPSVMAFLLGPTASRDGRGRRAGAWRSPPCRRPLLAGGERVELVGALPVDALAQDVGVAGVPGVLLDLVQRVPAQAPAGAALEPGRVGDGREHVEVGGADRGG